MDRYLLQFFALNKVCAGHSVSRGLNVGLVFYHRPRDALNNIMYRNRYMWRGNHRFAGRADRYTTAGAANFFICSFTSRNLHKTQANVFFEKKNTDLYFLVITVTPPI